MPSAASAERAQSAATSTNAQRATNADDALALGGTAAAGFRTLRRAAIPSGLTVTGAFGISSNVTTLSTPTNDIREVVQLPGLASADLSDETVNFANTPAAVDTDSSCTGSAAAPTAPPGRVCLYLTQTQGLTTTVDGEAIPLLLGAAPASSCTPAISTARPGLRHLGVHRSVTRVGLPVHR